MCKKVKEILSIVFVILFSFNVYGETFKNKATVSYKKFSGTKKQDIINQAINEACLKSVKIYVNSFDDAEYANYKKVKEKIANNLSDYVICTLIDGVQDKKAKTYSAVVKAKILTKEFNAVINQSSAIKSAGSGEKSKMVFAYFARRQTSSTEIGVSTDTGTESSLSESTVSEIAATDGQETIIYESSGASSSGKKEGDVSVTEEDVEVYAAAWKAADEVTFAINKYFTHANYNMIDIYEMGDSAADLYEAMMEEFAETGTPSRRTKSKLNRILRSKDVDFFVFGTLTLGKKEIDQSTGYTMTKATIGGAIYDLTGEDAEMITAVDPQVLSGLGTTQSESRTMATNSSAKKSANILINMLNNRGIK